MDFIKQQLARFDKFQRRHGALGFPLAVLKKYNDDEAGYQAAIITYYGFMSLFPLLLVFTSVLRIVLQHNPGVRERIVNSTYNFFPVVGTQLEHNIHGFGKNGLALAIGLILTLYGARGVADAFRRSVRKLWKVPRTEAAGFPMNIVKSLALILIGGVGLIGASLITGYTTTAGSPVVKALLVLASLLLLFGVFVAIIRLSLPIKVAVKDVWVGAAAMAIGLAALQAGGGYIVTHQLRHASTLYGTFAVVLGLLFWIYLQARVLLYALEIELVRTRRLWPRRLIGG